MDCGVAFARTGRKGSEVFREVKQGERRGRLALEEVYGLCLSGLSALSRLNVDTL